MGRMRLVGLAGVAACLAVAGCAPYPYGYYAARQPYAVTPGVPPEPVAGNLPPAEPDSASYAQPDPAEAQPVSPQAGYPQAEYSQAASPAPVPGYYAYAPQGYYGYAPHSYYAYAPQSYYGYAPPAYYGYASPPYVTGPSVRDGGRERAERERADRDRLNRERADRERLARERVERDRLNQEREDRDLIRERVLRPAGGQPPRSLEGPARVQDFRQTPPPAAAPPASAPQRPPQARPGFSPEQLRQLP